MKTFYLCGRSVAAVALLALPSLAAHAASPSQPVKSTAVTLEPMPGGQAKRVILTPKAVERLGIETSPVQEQAITRRQMVGGLVIPAGSAAAEPKPAGGFAGFVQGAAVTDSPAKAQAHAQRAGTSAGASAPGFTRAAASTAANAGSGVAGFVLPAAPANAPPVAADKPVITGAAWVSIALTPGEWERLARDKPVRLLPLATREALSREVLAQPTGTPPREDAKRSMLTVYYAVPGTDHGLTMNQRMRVELQITGAEDKQKVVPYSSVYYDAKGNAWVYLNPKPYVFERQKVTVDRIAGNFAVLAEGPETGTAVVSTGAALLYGAEIFGK
jgi:hypothetical protein